MHGPLVPKGVDEPIPATSLSLVTSTPFMLLALQGRGIIAYVS